MPSKHVNQMGERIGGRAQPESSAQNRARAPLVGHIEAESGRSYGGRRRGEKKESAEANGSRQTDESRSGSGAGSAPDPHLDPTFVAKIAISLEELI